MMYHEEDHSSGYGSSRKARLAWRITRRSNDRQREQSGRERSHLAKSPVERRQVRRERRVVGSPGIWRDITEARTGECFDAVD